MKLDAIRERFQQLLKGEPEVSVVMPAYNEEENILRTLSSLSRTITRSAAIRYCGQSSISPLSS